MDVNPPQFTNDRSKITDPAGGAVFVVRFAPQTDGLITGIRVRYAGAVFEHFNNVHLLYLSIEIFEIRCVRSNERTITSNGYANMPSGHELNEDGAGSSHQTDPEERRTIKGLDAVFGAAPH